MTADEIKAYYWLEIEIREEKKRLLELQAKATGATQKLSDMPGSKTTGDKIGHYALLLAEAKDTLNAKRATANEIRKKILAFVDAIDDPMMRNIIQYRYLNILSWKMVAYFVGGKNTKDSVRKRAERFLESL